MKYQYLGNGDFIQGLPMQEVDEDMLTDEQKVLLKQAIAAGMYNSMGSKVKADSGKSKPQDTASNAPGNEAANGPSEA